MQVLSALDPLGTPNRRTPVGSGSEPTVNEVIF